MRMEELSNSMYIKRTDSVEAYLLNVIQEYFKGNGAASTSSKEFIIQQVVRKVKEELDFEGVGVLSITLPDGQKRVGDVTITLEDLNGEPAIVPKNTAFNVNFGDTQNTACEGNDPRLSDARKPLPHEHEISDIIGLEGILSTITGKIERVGNLQHEHTNKNVLDILTYTGDKNSIDLAILDNLEDDIKELVEKIKQDIISYKEEINNKSTEVEQKVTQLKEEINNVQKYIEDKNKEYYELSKKFTDEKITEVNENIQKILNDYTKKTELNNLISLVNDSYTLAGTMEIKVKDIFDITSDDKNFLSVVNIDNSILSELSTRNQSISECQIEATIKYNNGAVDIYSPIPYVMIKGTSVDGYLQIGTSFLDKKISVKVNSNTGGISPEIHDAVIIYKVYSKSNITL